VWWYGDSHGYAKCVGKGATKSRFWKSQGLNKPDIMLILKELNGQFSIIKQKIYLPVNTSHQDNDKC